VNAAPDRILCDATLRHSHGVAQCFDLPRGHDGKHEGVCDACDEDGEYVVLRWTGEGRTEWPI
jgi:hypothetical protein